MKSSYYYESKKRSKAKPIVLSILLALSALFFFSPRFISTDFFEHFYSRGLYPKIAKLLIPISDLSSLSFSFLFIALITVSVLFWMVFSWRKRSGVFSWFFSVLSSLLGLSLIIYILFFILWGANYHRYSVEKLFNLNDVAMTEADLENFLDGLEPILLNPPSNRNIDSAIISIKKSLKETVKNISGVEPTLPRIKKTIPGSLIRFGNSSGVSSPYLLEAHVDSALSDTYFVKVAAHELAHIAGFAGEADAEFVSAMAALHSDNEFARYSAALDIYISMANRLAKNSRKERYKKLPDIAKADIKNIYEPFEKYSPPKWFENAQMRLYGTYLKSQGVSEGYFDYSRDIKLLIAADKENLVFSDDARE